MSDSEIDALLQEGCRFPPSDAFRATTHVADDSLYKEAEKDYEAFWARMAGELDWITPWSKVLEWNPPHARWFTGGKLKEKYADEA
jgi:acetyl-CoA synthetase